MLDGANLIKKAGMLLTLTLHDPIENHCAEQNGKTSKNSLTDICILQRFQDIFA
jgi:hypothetical protein